MDDLLLQRGAIPVELDRPRILLFDHKATWALYQKYGPRFLLDLYLPKKVGDRTDIVLQSMDALAFYLHAGLQAEAERHGETLSLEDVAKMIHPWNVTHVLERVVFAVVGASATPSMLGKATATGQAAKPAATKTVPPHPGPTRVMTSTKRSASRSRSSAGARSGSGRRRSGS